MPFSRIAKRPVSHLGALVKQADPAIAGTGCLAVALVALAGLSWSFPYGAPIEATPWASYLAIGALAGAGFLWMASGLDRQDRGRSVLLAVFVVGLGLRLAMMVSNPVFEDDWYRYLWDGAALANGVDPYAHPPVAAAAQDVFGAPRPAAEDAGLAQLQHLAATHPQMHERVNYPYLSTIYPPVAQGAFGAASVVSPFSLTAWRGVLLLMDIAAFAILVQVLRHIGRPLAWGALYWLNPLVITQIFGAGHMDGLLAPFLLATLWMALTARPAIAGFMLAMAVGVKLWPVLLFPALVMQFRRDRAGLLRMTGVFAILVAILLAPQALRALQPADSLGAYSTSWQTHTFLFPILQDFVLGWSEARDLLARMLVAGIVAGVAIATALKFSGTSRDRLADAWIVVIGTLIFLSPTGYPWYAAWFAPLLALAPNRGLLLLCATAPLYYLRFVLGDEHWLYLWVIVPLAFLPALALFVRDGARAWSSS